MVRKELLRRIGLTGSESKVYLALLKIGGFTSKRDILKESKIAASKVYHVLDKLIDKGLASVIVKRNVKHFSAAPPERIKDYVEQKRKQIEDEERVAKEVVPELNKLYKSFREQTTAEVFFGWKGLETVYSSLMSDMRKGDQICVMGASKGAHPEKTARFFKKYGSRARQKGVKVRVLFNEGARKYNKEMEKELGFTFEKRFLFKNTPVETIFSKDFVGIIMLKEEPMAVLIKDRETAMSFKAYFEELWRVGKR